jgi:hypothetical protein
MDYYEPCQDLVIYIFNSRVGNNKAFKPDSSWKKKFNFLIFGHGVFRVNFGQRKSRNLTIIL